MVEGLRVGLALIIPWLAGTLWVRALWREAPAGVWPLALGYGYFLGLLTAIMLLRAQAAAGWSLDWTGPTLALAFLGLAGGGLAVLQRNRTVHSENRPVRNENRPAHNEKHHNIRRLSSKSRFSSNVAMVWKSRPPQRCL